MREDNRKGPMGVTRHNRHVVLLRERLKPLGLRPTPTILYRVLREIGWDVDLALTAFVLDPRPAWVERIAGPRHT